MPSVLEQYQSSKKEAKPVGIPGLPMNRPLMTGGPAGLIGLELEVEGRRLPNEGYLDGIIGKKSRATWTTHRDGSLRGENLEYVLSRPCMLDEVPDLVSGLYRVFDSQRAILAPSNRCSTHVHVNINGLKVNEITSMIGLWTVFEQPLIEYCGEFRKTNHFCLSNKDAPSAVNAWDNFLESGMRQFNDGLKYSACNILTIFSYGSLEFRVAPLWTDPDRVISWSKFLAALREYVTTELKNPTALAYSLSELSGAELFRRVCAIDESLADFRDAVLAMYPSEEDFSYACLSGLRSCQSLILGHPWHEWMDMIDAEYIPNPFERQNQYAPARPGRRFREMRIDTGDEPDAGF